MRGNQKHADGVPSGVPEFKTNLPALDKLLGHNEIRGAGTGIRPGDIILLRGGPGSGKTTLGLQIMSSYLASDDCRYASGRLAAVFLSLEADPHKVIDKVTTDFHFFRKRRTHLVALPASFMRYTLLRLGRGLSGRRQGPVMGPVMEGIAKFGAGCVIGAAKDVVVPVARLFAEWGRSFLSAATASSVEDDETAASPPSSRDSGQQATTIEPEGILFIDSINALLAIVHQYADLDHGKARPALNRALAMIRKKFKRFVILVSSEFHRERSWVPTGMAESFLSDVEILLTNEPIAVPAGYEASRQGSVGYNIFKIIDKVQGEEGSKLESRSFIRVVKSRKGANQSRRCAYDIVTGSGLTFYETYPGDGHILLFTENPQQKDVWDTFFREDLPELYPALRYEDFDRSSLQRIFMNQRRSRYVPDRTDMYVSSFDNYWINWYGELCWRRAVLEGIEVSTPAPSTNEDKVRVAGLTSALHRSLMDRPQGLEQCLSDILKSNESWVLDEVLTAFASLSRRNNCMKCFFCRFSWWVLEGIAAENAMALEDAVACMPKENERAGTNQGAPKGATQWPKLADPDEAQKITDILHRMLKSAGEFGCCASSPVRQFFGEFGGPRISILARMEAIRRSAYEKPADSEGDMLKNLAGEISRILTRRQANAAELFDAVDRITPWMRSQDAKRRLMEELLSCGANAQAGDPESEVTEILRRHFAEGGGCECRVEFWKYLSRVLSRRADGAQDGPAKKGKSEEIRASLAAKSYETLNAMFDALPPMLLDAQGTGPERRESVVDLWMQYTGDGLHQARYNLLATYHLVFRKRNTFHFLSDMPDERIRLFGERRTRIIGELEEPSSDDKRPLHRPGLVFSMRDARSLVSIPYNANVSFMVYRHDLVEKFIKDHVCKGNRPGNDYKEYVDRVLTLCEKEFRDMGTLGGKSPIPRGEKDKIRRLVQANIRQYLECSQRKERSLEGPLQTWEELIVLLRWMNEASPSMSQSDKPPSSRHFVIETQTLDTLLCAVLELLWNCGGSLRIRPDYSIEHEEDTREKLFQALYLLATMLSEGIIPDDSTLDATHFAKMYSTDATGRALGGHDWVFARQWYSTLVELLTEEKSQPSQAGATAREVAGSAFLWQNQSAELGIMPIPISVSYYLQCRNEDKQAKHISCWGDWHLIMTRGTENTELGIDLINSLMTSQKVCERAFQCAAIPTVEEFYTLYGDSRALSLPKRRYETPRMLPDITFNDLRTSLFPNARSRSQIFDFEHCMLELQSLFQFVRILARTDHLDWSKPRKKGQTLSRSQELTNEIGAALGRIQALRTRGMLTV